MAMNCAGSVPASMCGGRVGRRGAQGRGAVRVPGAPRAVGAVRASPVRAGTRVVASAGLPIDLTGKRALIAGVADDQGYGWAIAKYLAAAGAEIIIGTWVPAVSIFETSLRRDKLDTALPGGGNIDVKKVYALDASFCTPEDVPAEVLDNKRYQGAKNPYTVSEVADQIKADFGTIDILVHSLANGPEVKNNLLDTSRNGYLSAVSNSSYSFVSLLRYLGPIMNEGGSCISLTYIASERCIPGYGGGMSSAKAALESDTKVLAYEAGRKWGLTVNTISAGPLASRAARSIGFIGDMIDYSEFNAPLPRPLYSENIGSVAAFLCSPLASSVTGTCMYVDNGLHAMGIAMDSMSLTMNQDKLKEPKSTA